MELLAPAAVAKRLGLSTSRVSQLDRLGRLPALRDSSGRRIWPADVVERFLAERKAAKAQEAADAA